MILCLFGKPSRQHHDQGREFENRFFSELQKLCWIHHSRTTTYYAQGNGQVERFNRTLLKMLRTLEPSFKHDWKSHLNKAVHAYSCTKNETTGYSPFLLLFGRHPTLPIDLIFQKLQPSKRKCTYSQYVTQWKTRTEEVYKLAKKMSNKGKSQYEKDLLCARSCLGKEPFMPSSHQRRMPRFESASKAMSFLFTFPKISRSPK